MLKTDSGKRYGVIDIGSNSVRLMIWQNGKTISKYAEITRLAQGLSEKSELQSDSSKRTAQAVFNFYNKAKEELVDKIYAFGTAAVRKAVNRRMLFDDVKALCPLEIEVVSGEKEAMLGMLGALQGKDGAIIDIGGASTEINIVKGGRSIYAKSLDIGVVRIYDNCGDDLIKREKYISKFVNEFGKLPSSDYYGIGGTATSMASVLLELEPYDTTKTHGYRLELQTVKELSQRLDKMSLEEREKLKGLQPKRARVIGGGVALLLKIMQENSIQYVTVSENDNLEGFVMDKLGEKYE